MTGGRLRQSLSLVAWMALVVLALVGLHRLGEGPLAPPPTQGSLVWLAEVGPATAAVALLRIMAMAVGGYLVGVTALALIMRALRAPGAAALLVEAASPRWIRRLVHGVTGLTIAVSATTSVAAADPGATDDVPVMVRGAGEHQTADEPVMRRLPDAPPPADGADVEAPVIPAATRTVRPGEHFWSIAESELAAVRKRPVSDLEIDDYWRRLVDANRAIAVDPDLLFPGQVVHIPPVSDG